METCTSGNFGIKAVILLAAFLYVLKKRAKTKFELSLYMVGARPKSKK